MADETIGSLGVDIVADYSQLQTELSAAVSAAESAGDSIASAFTSAANATDLAGGQLQIFQGILKADEDAGISLSQSLTDLAASAGTVGDEVAQAAQALIDQQKAAEQAADATQSVGKAADDAGNSMQQFGGDAEGAAHETEGFASKLGEVAELMGLGLGMAEGIESLKEFASESIKAYEDIQFAQVALTSLTGSAEKADEILEKLKDVASTSIFSFPDLAGAAQRMSALGIAANSIPGALRAAADAAELTGGSLDRVSGALDRIYTSGQVSGRSLLQLGLNMNDLASQMGINADQVTAAFKNMGSGSQQAIETLVAAMETKFAAGAEAATDTVKVAVNSLKTEWDSLLEDVGKEVSPDFTQFLASLRDLLPPIAEVAAGLAGIAAETFSDLLNTLSVLKNSLHGLGKEAEDAANAIFSIGGKTVTQNVSDFNALFTTLGVLLAHDSDQSKQLAEDSDSLKNSFDFLGGSVKVFSAATETAGTDTVNLKGYFGQLKIATDEAGASVEGFHGKLTAGKEHVDSYAQAMKAMSLAFQTVPTEAQQAQQGIDKINESIIKQNSNLTEAINVWKEMALSGTASAQAQSAAWKIVESDAKAAGVSEDQLHDKIYGVAQDYSNLQTVIINGHSTMVAAAGDANAVTLSAGQLADALSHLPTQTNQAASGLTILGENAATAGTNVNFLSGQAGQATGKVNDYAVATENANIHQQDFGNSVGMSTDLLKLLKTAAMDPVTASLWDQDKSLQTLAQDWGKASAAAANYGMTIKGLQGLLSGKTSIGDPSLGVSPGDALAAALDAQSGLSQFTANMNAGFTSTATSSSNQPVSIINGVPYTAGSTAGQASPSGGAEPGSGPESIGGQSGPSALGRTSAAAQQLIDDLNSLSDAMDSASAVDVPALSKALSDANQQFNALGKTTVGASDTIKSMMDNIAQGLNDLSASAADQATVVSTATDSSNALASSISGTGSAIDALMEAGSPLQDALMQLGVTMTYLNGVVSFTGTDAAKVQQATLDYNIALSETNAAAAKATPVLQNFADVIKTVGASAGPSAAPSAQDPDVPDPWNYTWDGYKWVQMPRTSRGPVQTGNPTAGAPPAPAAASSAAYSGDPVGSSPGPGYSWNGYSWVFHNFFADKTPAAASPLAGPASGPDMSSKPPTGDYYWNGSAWISLEGQPYTPPASSSSITAGASVSGSVPSYETATAPVNGQPQFTVNVNMSGATVYGQGGAQMMAEALTKTLQSTASQLRFG